ncbi:hypothetical protein HBB16_14265 [Pseudonocardia sp. MCCB 268]|nr:hypothetical protein [Pseudonocardia cytotoxica]
MRAVVRGCSSSPAGTRGPRRSPRRGSCRRQRVARWELRSRHRWRSSGRSRRTGSGRRCWLVVARTGAPVVDGAERRVTPCRGATSMGGGSPDGRLGQRQAPAPRTGTGVGGESRECPAGQTDGHEQGRPTPPPTASVAAATGRYDVW